MTPEPRALIIARPGLIARVLESRQPIVISAPAGFGATTALAAAMRAQPLPVLWVSADAPSEGADIAWTALGRAVGIARPAVPTVDEVLDRLHAAPASWLVLDRLQPPAHDDSRLPYLIRHLPAQHSLALSTEWVPSALGLGGAAITVLDEADLAMADDEAAELLLERVPGLDVEQAEEAIRTCQGWALALNAVANQAASGHGVAATEWLGGTGCDLLLQPWWQVLTQPQQELLESTTFLRELHPGLVNAALATTAASAVLEELTLRKGHLRMTGEVNDGAWWTRTKLLERFLARRHLEIPVDRYSRAADWLMATDREDEALAHLRSAGRDDEAARFLRRHEDEWFTYGRAERALSAYQDVAPDQLAPAMAHHLRLGWARALSGDRPGADAELKHVLTLHTVASRHPDFGTGAADSWRSEPSLADTNLEGEVRLFQAQMACLGGDTALMATAARAAVDAFVDGDASRTSHQYAPIMLGRALVWGGNIPAARTLVDQLAQHPVPNDRLREAVLQGLQADVLVADGRVYEGRVLSERTMAWYAQTGADPTRSGDPAPLLAHLYALTEGGALNQASQLAANLVPVLDERQLTGPLVRALTIVARAELAMGNLPAALSTIGRARRALRESAPRSTMAIPLDIVEIAVRLAGGDPLRAERLALQLPAGESRTLLSAQVTVRRHSQRPARVLADFRGSTPRSEASRHVILAAAELRRSTRLAEAHLVKAADIAIAEGMALLMVGSGTELLTFAESTARRLSHDGLAALSSGALANVATPAAPAGLVSDLSRGEIELLAFLPGRETNAEIAAELGVTINTVKTRMQRLYRKLGVASRNEAVRVARARNLLPRSSVGRVPRQG